MRKVKLMENVRVEAMKASAYALIVISLVFGGIMPLVIGTVLRTVAVLLAGYYCLKAAEGMIAALIEANKEPRRELTIVDLSKGTVKRS